MSNNEFHKKTKRKEYENECNSLQDQLGGIKRQIELKMEYLDSVENSYVSVRTDKAKVKK